MNQITLIKTEADYEKALARIDQIFDAQPDTPNGDELELLTTLVNLYEEKQYPIDFPNPIDAIKFTMEQRELRPVDLVPFLGSKSKVSEVLSGKRSLSLAMIRKLSKGLHIPAEILIQETA